MLLSLIAKLIWIIAYCSSDCQILLRDAALIAKLFWSFAYCSSLIAKQYCVLLSLIAKLIKEFRALLPL